MRNVAHFFSASFLLAHHMKHFHGNAETSNASCVNDSTFQHKDSIDANNNVYAEGDASVMYNKPAEAIDSVSNCADSNASAASSKPAEDLEFVHASVCVDIVDFVHDDHVNIGSLDVDEACGESETLPARPDLNEDGSSSGDETLSVDEACGESETLGLSMDEVHGCDSDEVPNGNKVNE